MKDLLEEIKLVEEQMQKYEKAYADECTLVYKQEGFDYYKPKWKKKIEKIAIKYADLLIPLKDKHKELRKQANEREEEIRKSKYRDTY